MSRQHTLRLAYSKVLGWCILRYCCCQGSGNDMTITRVCLMPSGLILSLHKMHGKMCCPCTSSRVLRGNEPRQHRVWCYCTQNPKRLMKHSGIAVEISSQQTCGLSDCRLGSISITSNVKGRCNTKNLTSKLIVANNNELPERLQLPELLRDAAWKKV